MPDGVQAMQGPRQVPCLASVTPPAGVLDPNPGIQGGQGMLCNYHPYNKGYTLARLDQACTFLDLHTQDSKGSHDPYKVHTQVCKDSNHRRLDRNKVHTQVSKDSYLTRRSLSFRMIKC